SSEGTHATMRIAMVSIGTDADDGMDRTGSGAGTLLAALCARHDVVVDTEEGDVAVPAGARVRRHAVMQSGTGRLAERLPRLAESLELAWRTERPDLVYVPGSAVALAAGAAVRELGLPLVLSLHAADPRGPGAAATAVARCADRVLVTSREQAAGLVRSGVRRSVTRVVPPGVDVRSLGPDGTVMRRGNRPRLVTTCGIGRDSGVDDVIAALRILPAAELFVACGPGLGEQGRAELVRCRRAAAEAGVARRVHLVAITLDALGPLLRSADVVVDVPRHRARGRAVLEAMACGRPVVASDMAPLNELVVDEVTGLLVAPGRPAELGRAVARLLGQPSLPTAFGIAGRDRVLARYSWERVGAAVSAVLGEAVDARRPAAVG
ncbi:MAG: glycosyltransferase family 4 protein, partial [Pseudonocardia sp.]|nr:glycosyltransferase family 4 protein [Pseudonocardia sp.]